MKLDFKLYKLKQSSKQCKQLVKSEVDNQFIIVGEDISLNCYNAHQLENNQIMLIGGLDIVECALLIYKDDLELDCDGISYCTCELDIPKKNLTVDIIADIKRLND